MKPNAREAYARSGVNVDLADEVKESIARAAKTTLRPEVLGSGFFGSMFHLRGYQSPVLVSSTDGVGTKVKIAALLDRNDAVGMDIVNHCVNDILCCGAEPLFFLDYIAMDKLVPRQVESIISGIVAACKEVGCCLVGGETAEMPGIYSQASYDVVGFIVGVVERENIMDGNSIVPGDMVIGLPSSGLHTNGYSLARKALGIDANPSCLNEFYPELGQKLGDALLQVHRCYYLELKGILPLIKGMAHITGGGFSGNIPRSLPRGVAVRLHKARWDVPPIFKLIQERGKIEQAEMYRVFNMGIGMAVICSPEQASVTTTTLPQARVIGDVIKAEAEGIVIIN